MCIMNEFEQWAEKLGLSIIMEVALYVYMGWEVC